MFIVQEMQTNGNQTVLVPPITKTNLNEAKSAFYQAAMYAAVSAVEVHTIMLHDERGDVIDKLVFDHPAE